MRNFIIFNSIYFSAPPELFTEKAWIHAAEGSEVELVCTLQSDMNTDVINFVFTMYRCDMKKLCLNSKIRLKIKENAR
jgi:hypothetical protein